MRLRLAFKLHGDEADLARQISHAAGVEVDTIAKLAMQRYMREVLERAEKAAKQAQASAEENSNGQPSQADPVHSAGVVSDAPDSVSSQASGQS